MIKQLEKEIRESQKELAEVQKNQNVLRFQPCRGDSEIREKDKKMDNLARRAAILRETIRSLTRKRQLLISESTQKDREPGTSVPAGKRSDDPPEKS
jgi:hypothetical protein